MDIRANGIRIHNQIVNFIPLIPNEAARSLKWLDIDKCHLKVVTKDDLKQFRRLKHLSLINNDLEWLEGDLFHYNPKLEEVFFYYNDNLMFIGANLLDSLTKLVEAVFNPIGCIGFESYKELELHEVKEKLKTSCKDESTELKMLSDQKTYVNKNTFSLKDVVLSFTVPALTSTTAITPTTPTPTPALSTVTPISSNSQLHETLVTRSSDKKNDFNSARRLVPVLPQVFFVIIVLTAIKPLWLVRF